jgi:medium-chain acyl-[acyl-carrier-protein] hydrolase
MQRDLDMNRHVNHTVYLQWALEALPPEWLEALALQSIEMAFLAEAGPGDTITTGFAELWQDAGARALAHCIVHSGTGRELARLRTTWTE